MAASTPRLGGTVEYQVIRSKDAWESWVEAMREYNEGFDPPEPKQYPCYLLWYRESILIVHAVLDSVDLRVMDRQLTIARWRTDGP